MIKSILQKIFLNLNLNAKAPRESHLRLGQSSILASRAASPSFRNLWDAEVKVFSQWGEDGILDYLVSKLGIHKPKVIEIGAGNFTECNSRYLAENLNASVVAVDGRGDLLKSINETDLTWKSHILGIETWVTPENINHLIKEGHKFMAGIDIFSLDLDGNDFWILREADLSQVRVVIVEYNPLFGKTHEVTVPRNDLFDRTSIHESWLYYGASLLAFVGELKKKGFTFVGTNRVGNNAFFVTSSDASLIPFQPDPKDSIFYDWRIRESRDSDGHLNFLSGFLRQSAMSKMPLIDLKTDQIISVEEVNQK
jgi:hypothetical protein